MTERRIERWVQGDKLEARKLDQPRQFLEILTQRSEPLSELRQGTVWSPARFRITANAGDYVTCVRVLASGAATQTTQVAKPPVLRNSVTSLAGVTYSYTGTDARTANDGSGTEDQVIVAPYTTGLDLFAIRVRGGTGVSAAPVWLDLNVDGRMWAESA